MALSLKPRDRPRPDANGRTGLRRLTAPAKRGAALKSGPNLPTKIAEHDDIRFLRGWMGNPLKTGAIAPSGQALARTMAGMIDPTLPGPILELGPGTGAMTRALIAAGIPEERLVLIEYAPEFAALLSARYPQATVVQGDAYAISDRVRELGLAPAAGIVSSLPLMNRPASARAALLADAFSILHPEGALVQFTYLPKAPIGQHHIRGRVAARIDHSPIVWRNLPPARVWRYRPEGPA
ncbi:MAG: methyltransferase domain-containing protein [Pseudomonadota bacterium]